MKRKYTVTITYTLPAEVKPSLKKQTQAWRVEAALSVGHGVFEDRAVIRSVSVVGESNSRYGHPVVGGHLFQERETEP